MNDRMLTCVLEIIPIRPGEIGFAFHLHNPHLKPVEVYYFTPFLQFELSVQVDGQPIPLVQPAYDTGMQPVRRWIAPGESIRIETPIKLAFDPHAPPSGGDIPTRWSLKHLPVPVDLIITIKLDGAVAAPCQARWDPQPD